MEDFPSNNEYHFMKNLTPCLFAVNPSYETYKAELMHDVRLLCSALDGKIPPLQTSDPEQLKGPSQPPPFSMPLKLLILHSEVKSECFTIGYVPESTFNYL